MNFLITLLIGHPYIQLCNYKTVYKVWGMSPLLHLTLWSYDFIRYLWWMQYKLPNK